LTEITYNGSNVLIMCVVGVWRYIMDLWWVCALRQTPTQRTHSPKVQNMPPNTDHAHNKHIWNIICKFSQVQVITPWWWILRDLEHVGV